MVSGIDLKKGELNVTFDVQAGVAADEATIVGDMQRLLACDTSFPPGDGWTRPALACTSEVRAPYGRGAADMKRTVVAVLAALQAADQAGVALYYAPHLLLSTDE